MKFFLGNPVVHEVFFGSPSNMFEINTSNAAATSGSLETSDFPFEFFKLKACLYEPAI